MQGIDAIAARFSDKRLQLLWIQFDWEVSHLGLRWLVVRRCVHLRLGRRPCRCTSHRLRRSPRRRVRNSLSRWLAMVVSLLPQGLENKLAT